ncbi:MAG: hypothetical protein JO340_18460 [Acidobacteriaceae bacterium]|nr:hypothetical protein [Acidobacteriaceae bacterium]
MTSPECTREIEQNFADLRSAMQERRYSEAQTLLEEQRLIFGKLRLEDLDACELLRQAQDLANWALMLARVQHSHTEQAFASLLKIKQLDAGYLPSPVCSAELVSVRG